MDDRSSKTLRGLEPERRLGLVISECQPAVIDPDIAMFPALAEQAQARGLIAAVARLANICRRSGVPVVHAVVRLPEGGGSPGRSRLQAIMAKNALLRRGRPESELDPRLGPLPGDLISERNAGVTAFHGSDLEDRLRAAGVDTLLLAGVSTNIALLGTTIEALNRGFGVVLVEDCTAGASVATHAHAIVHTFPVVATVVALAEVEQALAGRAFAVAPQPA